MDEKTGATHAVTDTFPLDGVAVLVWGLIEQRWFIAKWDGNMWAHQHNLWVTSGREAISHWMPLPRPPSSAPE